MTANDMMTLRALLEKSSDADLLREMIGFSAVRQMAQFLDLAFEFGNRFFEIERGRHGPKNRDYRRKFNRAESKFGYRHTAIPVFFTIS